ncbi:MAG: SPASM domain-containing protein, partial [Dehalococcoidia bacterium]|nr:SPASM domain-containing protein [Dehalococcoidia bacterium]
GCFWLWHAMVIGWDGEVFPCCLWAHFDIGNAIQTSSKEIWRGERYRGLRQGFASEASRSEMHPVCKRCMSGKPVAAVYEPGVTAASSRTAGSAAP